MSEQNSQRLGALWLKEGARGKFFSGELELSVEMLNGLDEDSRGNVKIPVVVFKNTTKKNAKGPDYDILKGRDREQRQQRPARNSDPKPLSEPITDDDIPF